MASSNFSRKHNVRKESSSTINSSEANHRFQQSNQRLSQRNQPIPDHLRNKNQIQMNINASNDIKVGDHVTNVYYNIKSKVTFFIMRQRSFCLFKVSILTDSDNPAFVLNTDNLSCRKKTTYVLGQKWCWGIIFIVLILTLFINTLIIVLWPRPPPVFVIDRGGWGARLPQGDLVLSRLPAWRVIVSHTNDMDESCTTFVRYLDMLITICFTFILKAFNIETRVAKNMNF